MRKLILPAGPLFVIVAIAGFWLLISRGARDDVWSKRVVWSSTCTIKSLDPVKNGTDIDGYDLKFACSDRTLVWNDSNLVARFLKKEPVPSLFCTVSKSKKVVCKIN